MRVPGVGRALAGDRWSSASRPPVWPLVAAGGPQLVGALAGTALVAGFFLFGMVNTALAAAFAPRAALRGRAADLHPAGGGLGTAPRRGSPGPALTADRLDVRWLGGTVIAGALGWTVALVVDAAPDAGRRSHPRRWAVR